MTDDKLRAALDWMIDHSVPSHEATCAALPEDEDCICGVSAEYERILALAASATDEGPREEFGERWCPNGCGTVLAPSQDHYDGADGYVCRPTVPEALDDWATIRELAEAFKPDSDAAANAMRLAELRRAILDARPAVPALDVDHVLNAHYAQVVTCSLPGCPLDWNNAKAAHDAAPDPEEPTDDRR